MAVVLGASGYMGSNMVPALAAQGWHVRATARNPAVLEAREWQASNACRWTCSSRILFRR